MTEQEWLTSNPMRWTTADEQRAVEMRRQGMTVRDIAAQLGRNQQTVNHRLWLLGVRKPRRPLSYWLALFQRRHTLGGLAVQHGVTRSAVWYYKKQLRELGYELWER